MELFFLESGTVGFHAVVVSQLAWCNNFDMQSSDAGVSLVVGREIAAAMTVSFEMSCFDSVSSP